MLFKKNALPFAALMVFASCGSKPEKAEPVTAPVNVTIKAITTTGQPETLRYSGTIEADNTVSLGFSVPGRITAVTVQEGQLVKAGQLLATIETPEYDNALLIAGAGLEQAADNFKRLDELHAKGSLPERDYIAAKVTLAQATANKSLSAKRLSDTKLYAPFAGIVSGKLVEKGATAAPGVPAFTLMKTDQVYALAAITESEIGKLSVGKQANINIPVLQQSLTGKISIINPQGDAASKTFAVKIRLTNNSGHLLPGMIADIAIHTGQTLQAITVPATAFVRDADGLPYVFVVKDKKAIRKRVSTGNLSSNEVIVTEGLQPGDQVVITGQTRLKDGSLVVIQ